MSTDAGPIEPEEQPVCVPPPLSYVDPLLPLPADMLLEAAEIARQLNPANAPPAGILRALDDLADLAAPSEVPAPLRIALMTNMYFGPEPRTLTVSFMEQTADALADKILGHMNAWQCGIKFRKAQGGAKGDVRISRGGGGYWSYLGVSILSIPKNQATMNLERFSMDTPESEWRRVVRHETGHTLGCPHEHMRADLVALLDPQKTYAYFRRSQGWTRSEVDQQVLTPLNERSLMSTPVDQDSIMCYQLPGSITKSGKPILGGDDINPSDAAFIRARYPDGAVPPPPPPPPTSTLTTRTPPSTADKQVTIGGKLYLVTTETTVTLTPAV